MKIKTSELIGPALDWVVASALGYTRSTIQGISWGRRWKKPAPVGFWDEVDSPDGIFRPSTDPSQGGPILTSQGITTRYDQRRKVGWEAFIWEPSQHDLTEQSSQKFWMFDKEQLVAGLRCYVASEMGDEVDIPEELLK